MEMQSMEDKITKLENEKLELEDKAKAALLQLAVVKERESQLTDQLSESRGRLEEMEEIVQAMDSEIERVNALRQQETTQLSQSILSLQQRLVKSQRNYEFSNNNFLEVNFVRKFNKKRISSLEEEIKELNEKVRSLKAKTSRLFKKNKVLLAEKAKVQDANKDLVKKLHTSRTTIHSLKNTKTMLMEEQGYLPLLNKDQKRIYYVHLD